MSEEKEKMHYTLMADLMRRVLNNQKKRHAKKREEEKTGITIDLPINNKD